MMCCLEKMITPILTVVQTGSSQFSTIFAFTELTVRDSVNTCHQMPAFKMLFFYEWHVAIENEPLGWMVSVKVRTQWNWLLISVCLSLKECKFQYSFLLISMEDKFTKNGNEDQNRTNVILSNFKVKVNSDTWLTVNLKATPHETYFKISF